MLVFHSLGELHCHACFFGFNRCRKKIQFKVCGADRKITKMVTASSVDNLLQKGQSSFITSAVASQAMQALV